MYTAAFSKQGTGGENLIVGGGMAWRVLMPLATSNRPYVSVWKPQSQDPSIFALLAILKVNR